MYGYYEYPDVITLPDAEKMLKEHRFVRPSTGEPPRNVAFIQCVGSRDRRLGNEYCSKVCCGVASKEAIEIRRLLPDTKVYIFYIDMRMYGFWENEIYWPAQEQYNVNYIRGIVTEIVGKDGRLLMKGEDTTMGRPLEVLMDVIVLSVGMEPSRGTRDVAGILGVAQNKYGFIALPGEPMDVGLDVGRRASSWPAPRPDPRTSRTRSAWPARRRSGRSARSAERPGPGRWRPDDLGSRGRRGRRLRPGRDRRRGRCAERGRVHARGARQDQRGGHRRRSPTCSPGKRADLAPYLAEEALARGERRGGPADPGPRLRDPAPLGRAPRRRRARRSWPRAIRDLVHGGGPRSRPGSPRSTTPSPGIDAPVRRELAGECLHFADPERHWLWSRWMWDPEARTGALPLVMVEDFDFSGRGRRRGLPAGRGRHGGRHRHGPTSSASSGCGASPFAVDVYLAAIYGIYLYTVTRLRMTQEFNKVIPQLPGPRPPPARRVVADRLRRR